MPSIALVFLVLCLAITSFADETEEVPAVASKVELRWAFVHKDTAWLDASGNGNHIVFADGKHEATLSSEIPPVPPAYLQSLICMGNNYVCGRNSTKSMKLWKRKIQLEMWAQPMTNRTQQIIAFEDVDTNQPAGVLRVGMGIPGCLPTNASDPLAMTMTFTFGDAVICLADPSIRYRVWQHIFLFAFYNEQNNTHHISLGVGNGDKLVSLSTLGTDATKAASWILPCGPCAEGFEGRIYDVRITSHSSST